MIPLNSSELIDLADKLKKFNLKSTITQIGGLLTAPELQANTVRIELLVHLAVAYCQGTQKPCLTDIDDWLNRQLGNTEIALLEDPVEDVFVTNIETPEGNRRIFEGIWESNDYFLQLILDILGKPETPKECRNLLIPAFALLRLSDYVAERVNVHRWHIEPSVPKDKIGLSEETKISDRARAITFTDKELDSLGVSRKQLTPFILRNADKFILRRESPGHSSLERRPLVDIGHSLVLALPSAVSPAIRRFVLTNMIRTGYLSSFSNILASYQANQVQKECLVVSDIKNQLVSLDPPKPKDKAPSLHAWLFNYDINKYLHIVLLHDKLEWLDAQGFSSFMKYPEELRAGLEEYLSKVSSYCRSLPNFAEGMTLLVLGGLGRGFALGFENWPDQWSFSAIRISDLLMLASELERPITRYLKCIKQKEWTEGKGIFFQIFSDYNFYCYWRRLNYQLVPRDLPVDDGSMISIGNDMVLPVREEVRKSGDRHVIETVDGIYSPVLRFGRDSYFKSLQDRPIYASLGHVRTGVLAGAVETPRGPSWLLMEPRKGDEQILHFIYEMWSGFIGLYDRLVFEVESLYPKTQPGAVEIRLNFTNVIIPKDYVKSEPGVMTDKPNVAVNIEQRTATINFPPDFLIHFQQPENIGERLVLYGIAKGLVSLRQQGAVRCVDEAVLDVLVNKVIGVSGMRVIHLFPTFYPIEYLLSRHGEKPIFLAHEDFVFSKLRLSEGCTTAKHGTNISLQSECNDFLKSVVIKIWNLLRKLLQQFDRASVIREALKVHESIINDRDHWRRTSQAILALYASREDVFAVAQERELDRNNVALPARTILEMAICECPEMGGRQLSRWDLDELLAKVALLIEVATDSDAIKSNLIESKIHLHPNGEYTVDRGFYKTVIEPFIAAYFREELEDAAGTYDKLYRSERPGEKKRAEDIYSAAFIGAFISEFSLTPDEAIDGFAELIDLAVECDSVIIETTLGNLKTRLTRSRGLSSRATEAYIRTFSIFHRPAWDKPPSGFTNKDLNPWRFRRRLSAMARPIFVFGEQDEAKVFFGAGALRLGFGYLLGKSENGHLPQEFFSSHAMKKYIGAVNDERGHEFARSVAEQLRENGWQVRNEVQMSELGGSAKLGDIDVLAWRSTGEIQLIECKRLQLARTVAEIAEICRRFRGDAKDELDKHVRRITWIRANPAGLQRIVGFAPDPTRIDDRLVTNTHVPMTYLKGLPIEADKIGPLR